MSDDRPHPSYLRAVPDSGAGFESTPDDNGEPVVDINAAARDRLQSEIRRLQASNDALIALAKANLAAQAQTHSAVLAILEADTLLALDRKLAGRVAATLNVEVVKVFIENHAPLQSAESIIGASPELVDALLGNDHDKLGPVDQRFADALYGSQASRLASEGIVRLEIGQRHGMLCLASREKDAFTDDQGSELMPFSAILRAAAWIEVEARADTGSRRTSSPTGVAKRTRWPFDRPLERRLVSLLRDV